jgi:hypothetical protein
MRRSRHHLGLQLLITGVRVGSQNYWIRFLRIVQNKAGTQLLHERNFPWRQVIGDISPFEEFHTCILFDRTARHVLTAQQMQKFYKLDVWAVGGIYTKPIQVAKCFSQNPYSPYWCRNFGVIGCWWYSSKLVPLIWKQRDTHICK